MLQYHSGTCIHEQAQLNRINIFHVSLMFSFSSKNYKNRHFGVF